MSRHVHDENCGHLNPAQVKQRVVTLLLAEISPEDAKRQWYYISIRHYTGSFYGCFVNAFGPTDAWRLMHILGLYFHDVDQDTSTMGPIDEEAMQKVPKDKRWVRLPKAEVDNFK
jgi:hypothetical protein